MRNAFRYACGGLLARAIGVVATWVCVIPSAGAQQLLLPADRDELADHEHLSSWTVDKIPSQSFMKEIYWDRRSQEMPAFFRDSLVQYVARTYYLTRDNSDGTKSQALAAGGWLAFRSGLIGDLFGVHAAFYGSEKLFAPADEGGTRLLAPGQNNINVLGQIYGRIQLGDQEIRGGRQLIDTPLINAQDNRMVPNTFEALTLVSLPDAERFYDYSVGYIWNVKQRDSNDFIPMSEALAGNSQQNHGAPYGMITLRPIPGLVLTAMDYNVDNFINSGFGQAEYDFRRPKGTPNFILGANVIGQTSVGENLLTGTPFETYQASVKAQMAYAGWTLFVAGSVTGNESRMFSPYGINANYTDMQQSSFDNAGEKAFGGSAAYDFTGVGLPGLSTGVWYAQGWGAVDPTSNLAIRDRRELDVWLQYRPTDGPLKGFRLKTQYASLWQQGNARPMQPEFRFIVDYTVLFRPAPTESSNR
jgi:hypothetical protein